MSDKYTQRMDAISAALARIVTRQEQLERRLAALEGGAGLQPAIPYLQNLPPLPQGSLPELPQENPPPLPLESVAPPVESLPPPQPPEFHSRPAQPKLETQVGLSWVNRIGAITLVLGVAFFFKYAVDNDWIGPTGRVLIGLLAGLAGIVTAERVWSCGHKVFAQGIAGASASVLYLSFYAAFSLYQLIGPSVAFLLMVASSVLAGALAFRYDSQAIAALSLIGGFVTPVILSTGEDHSLGFLSYLVLLDTAWIAVARLKKWAKLEWLALAGTTFLYSGWFEKWFQHEHRLLAGVSALLCYTIFATSGIAPVASLAQLLGSLAQAASWDRNPSQFGIFGFAVSAAGLAIADWRKRPSQAAASFSAGALSWALWYGDFSSSGKPRLAAFGIATAMFCLFFSWLPWRAWVRRTAVVASDLAVAALSGIAYFTAGYLVLDQDYHAWMGLFAVLVAGAYLALAYALWFAPDMAERRDTSAVPLACGLALGLLTLAAPIQFTGYRITMAWAIEGAILAWIARRAESQKLVWVALAVFFLVFIRLLSIDAGMYSKPQDYALLLNTRFLTFAVASISAILAARWIGGHLEAGAVYVGGHVSLLVGLGLEASGWAWRGDPIDASSLERVTISILMAAYGVALVGLGVSTRTLFNRWLGLGLLALVILKLYLLDVWEMARVYRIVAFGGLGILLLSTSYLYSRYGEKIESLLKEKASGEP